jgi:hypothetical protein
MAHRADEMQMQVRLGERNERPCHPDSLAGSRVPEGQFLE